jgi:hypothetical protein
MFLILMRFLLPIIFICPTIHSQVCDMDQESEALAERRMGLLRKQEINLESLDYSRFILSNSHPVKPILDDIFQRFNPLASSAAISNAGFTVISERPSSMRVLAHPDLPGYLLKLYPMDEKLNDQRDMSWAIKRCLGAENVHTLIEQLDLKYFVVPTKWIYFVPDQLALHNEGIKNFVVLLVKDMNVLSDSASSAAWHNVSTEVIDELYQILSRGYGSSNLTDNIPPTRDGTFSFIDTEAPQKQINYKHVKKHLSIEMQEYWEQLVQNGGDTPGFRITQMQLDILPPEDALEPDQC